ncbi:MAG: helix-turn-helix transcriptional regulator [Bacteroidetes bacterium]|nr:helix-turn-helix transcriptional regulator [Bacteroidota bacterium]
MNKIGIWKKKPEAVDETVVIKENIKAFSDPDYWFDVWFMKLLGSKGATKGVTIARRMGVSKSRVSDIVNDEADVQVSTLIKFALAVGFIPHLVMEPVEDYAKRVHNNSLMRVDRSDNIITPVPQAARSDSKGGLFTLSSVGEKELMIDYRPHAVYVEKGSERFANDYSPRMIESHGHR